MSVQLPQSHSAPQVAQGSTVTVLKFFTVTEQEALRFHLAQGSTNYVVGPDYSLLTFPECLGRTMLHLEVSCPWVRITDWEERDVGTGQQCVFGGSLHLVRWMDAYCIQGQDWPHTDQRQIHKEKWRPDDSDCQTVCAQALQATD